MVCRLRHGLLAALFESVPGRMFERAELFLVGLAVVLDTALLLIVRERANRTLVAVWLNLLVLGLGAFHGGTLGRILLSGSDAGVSLFFDHLCMVLLVFGLLLLPSGMLHAALRMERSGPNAQPIRDNRYGWLYAPLGLLPIAVGLIYRNDNRRLMEAIAILTPIYVVWLLVANTVACYCFYRIAHRFENSRAFFVRLIATLIVMTVVSVLYGMTSTWSSWERVLRLPVFIMPLAPAGLFVWYSLSRRILPLVLDRTLLYGSLVVIGLLLHRLTITPLSIVVRESVNIDLIIVEAILVIGLIVLIPPWRNRASEALRYMFSTNVFKVRDATRLLSLGLSQKSQLEVHDLLQWFADELSSQLDLDQAVIVLRKVSDRDSGWETVSSRSRSRDRMAPAVVAEDVELICHVLQSCDRMERGRIPSKSAFTDSNGKLAFGSTMEAVLERNRYLVAFRASFRTVEGAVLLGDRKRNDRFADEQLVAIGLLCEQLAATIENKRESMRRIQAERNMMQNEKLSVLGLIAGSLAHELRNPLSSIRTIASLTMEDLGQDHTNRKDLQLIVSEIDRLTQTTQRLLESAKPGDAVQQSIEPDVVLSRLLTILTPLAKKLHVELQIALNCQGNCIRSTEVAFTEIFFNLVKNAIEACAGSQIACVRIETQRIVLETGGAQICIRIEDNGPGIPVELQNSLYEPFVTGKSDGTGLGLYVVAERVRELEGEIKLLDHRRSGTGVGTTFEVRLMSCHVLSQPET